MAFDSCRSAVLPLYRQGATPYIVRMDDFIGCRTQEPDTVHDTRTIATGPIMRWMG